MSNHTDELKVYTGKETIEALLEGKILADKDDQYKLDGDKLMYKQNGKPEWETSGNYFTVGFLLTHKFTEVVTPQVGDWVRVYLENDIYIGQITEFSHGYRMHAEWVRHDGGTYHTYLNYNNDWEILSPEQVSKYKREQAFSKVGRKLNEWKSGDIVMIDNEGVIGVVVSKNNTDEIKVNEFNKALQGWSAKPHQLTPIAFTEQQVDLS